MRGPNCIYYLLIHMQGRCPVPNNLVVLLFNKNVQFQIYLLLSLSMFPQIYQGLLDKWTPHAKVRWVAAGFLVFLFLVRVFICQGWYIVCYALGIYHLNLFIAFLTPKMDPALDLDGKFSIQLFRHFINFRTKIF